MLVLTLKEESHFHSADGFSMHA